MRDKETGDKWRSTVTKSFESLIMLQGICCLWFVHVPWQHSSYKYCCKSHVRASFIHSHVHFQWSGFLRSGWNENTLFHCLKRNVVTNLASVPINGDCCTGLPASFKNGIKTIDKRVFHKSTSSQTLCKSRHLKQSLHKYFFFKNPFFVDEIRQEKFSNVLGQTLNRPKKKGFHQQFFYPVKVGECAIS